MTTPTKKPHVDDQNCGNCAWSRLAQVLCERPGLECRWDTPPWHAVLKTEWCRRWAPRPPPKKAAGGAP